MKIDKKTKDNYLLTDISFNGDCYAKVLAFPGFSKWEEGTRNRIVRINGVNTTYLLETWKDAEWSEQATIARDSFLQKEKNAVAVIENKKQMVGFLEDSSGYKYKRPPMDHQQRAFVMSRDKEVFAFFLEQGLGKTKVTLDTAGYLYEKGEIDMLVIVVYPNGLQMNWIDYELPEDLNVPYEAHYWSDKHKTKAHLAKFECVLNAENKLKVLAFNAECFVSLTSQKMIKRCLKENRCLLVVDQSACLKNPAAQRTKFMLDIAKSAKYRRILDGNAAAEGAVELFTQFKFLDADIIGHDTFTAYKSEFCISGYFNNITGYKNLDKLYNRIDGHSFRMLTEDCIDLPERSYMRFPFELNPRERRIFDEMRVKSLAYFSDSTCHGCAGAGVEGLYECPVCEGTGKPPKSEFIEQSMALVKNMRLQQISSGWFPTDEGVKPINEGKNPSRMVALKSLLENIEGKALIFARFKADLLAIQELLGKEAVSYHGSISQEDRMTNKRAFKEDNKVKYIVGQIRVLGIGHTLTEAEHVIFFNNDHSLRFREEAEKRVHRTGLKHQVKVWDLVARNTQDNKIIESLRKKKKIANEILRDKDNFFLDE